MTQKIEQERNYNVLQNASGELMILIKARLDNAQTPTLVYDKGEHALLYRNESNIVMLDYLHEQARPLLAQAHKVLVVETRDTSVVREYMTKIKMVKKIPEVLKV